jgi:putative RecB family exonuclease
MSMQAELSPPDYLSASSLATFKQCPLKFKFSKIDRIPDPSNQWAILGNFVHDILEDLYRLPSDMRTMDSARQLARELWESKWQREATSSLRGDTEKIRQFRWSAWWCVENLWRLEDPTFVSPMGMETEVTGKIGGVTMRGYVDRYSQTEGSLMLTVTDYKTGKVPRVDLDEKFAQLIIYAKLLSEMGIGDADHVELLYLKEGVRLKKEIKQSDLSRVVEEIQEVQAGIQSRCEVGSFEPKTSGLCHFCSYKRICPAWAN